MNFNCTILELKQKTSKIIPKESFQFLFLPTLDATIHQCF